MSATPRDVDGRPAAPVGLAPLRWLLPRLTVFLLAWAVLRAGRLVCLMAQHFPPAVWLVGAVYAWQVRRARTGSEQRGAGPARRGPAAAPMGRAEARRSAAPARPTLTGSRPGP